MNYVADTFHLNVFKSAADLNLTEEQRDALENTLLLLETGKLIHIPQGVLDSGDTPEEEMPREELLHFFNMAVWGGHDEGPTLLTSGKCGTACCIGGTAEWLAGKPLFNSNHFESESTPLYRLFNPDDLKDWNAITPAMAARVLRHYLMTGIVDWSPIKLEIGGTNDE